MTAAQPAHGDTLTNTGADRAGRYHRTTEVSPVSLVVSQQPGPTGEVFPGRHTPPCAEPTAPAPAHWTPNVEAAVVPDELWNICHDCPLRTQCLTQAVTHNEVGYWAGTTSADRHMLNAHGPPKLIAADNLRRARQVQRTADHAPGMGNTYWYSKRRCRCDECTAANTAAQARARARNRSRNRRATTPKGTRHAATHPAPAVSRLA